MELRWTPSPKLTGSLNVSRSSFFTDIDVSDREKSPQAFGLVNRISDKSLRAELTWEAFTDGNITLGLMRKTAHFSYRLDSDSHDFIRGNRHPETSAAYLSLARNLGSRLVVETGLRFDQFVIKDDRNQDKFSDIFPDYTHELRFFQPNSTGNIEPRLGLKYRISNNTQLKFATGIYHQYVTTLPIRDEALSLVDIWFPIDGKYRPIKATHFVMGFEQWLPLSSSLVIEVYQKNLSGLLERNVRFDPGLADGYFFPGKGTSRGIELLFRKSGRKFFGWLGYSYSRTIGKFNGQTYPLRYDRRHTLNMALYFTSWDRHWDAMINWTIASGLPYTPIVGKFRTPNYGGFNGKRDLKSTGFTWKTYTGPKNSARYPAYHRLDITISRRYIFRESIEVVPFFQAINAYGQENILIYRRTPSLRHRTGEMMLPFTPTVGLRVNF